MIPESAGATPFGIFLLADDYLGAARASAEVARIGSRGPTRLLCYHTAELFLKAYLRSYGMSVESLRRMQHDLPLMIGEAKLLGLVLRPRAIQKSSVIKARNDYVRVRYMVVEEAGGLTIHQALEFASDIREAVRTALDFDEHGNPRGQLWMAGEPADYLEAAGRPIR
ncbi:MAG: HEPN domain-containing protein [Alphaproteobacteria bacterium]|nr:HEPN domain-containing protein [Alphaproteobacteria bacterium]